MNQQITLSSNWGNTTTGGEFSNCPIGDWYEPYPYYPLVKEYYPVYYGFWNNEKNKTEQAFKVVERLNKSGKLKIETVKDFIEAVNEIVEVL